MKRLALSLLIASLSQLTFAAVEISNAIALHGKPALPANFLTARGFVLPRFLVGWR